MLLHLSNNRPQVMVRVIRDRIPGIAFALLTPRISQHSHGRQPSDQYSKSTKLRRKQKENIQRYAVPPSASNPM